MRQSRLLFCLLFGLATSLSLGAQDVHYTLHDYAPLWLNPANTGAFSGSIRAGGIYRGQWYSLNGISSPTLYADAPLGFALRKQDWIGVGISMVNDKSGDLDIIQNFFGFSGAYHLSLDKKRTNVLTLGVQYGSTSYGINPEGVLAQSINIGESPDFRDESANELTQMGGGLPGMNNDNESSNDLNAGVKLKILMDAKKGNTFEGGISFLHLNSPKRRTQLDTSMVGGGPNPNPNPTVGGNNNEDTRRRKGTIHAHARLDLEMSEKWRFQPTVFFQNSASTSSVSLQAWGQRALKNDLALRLGLGYRTADAAKVLVGLNWPQLRAALSYDITLSQARNPDSYQGAFELSAAYIFNIYKKPEVRKTILCPDI